MFRQDNTLTEKIRSLERKLAKEHKEAVRARATRARDAVERAEMEDFFMQCVEVSELHRALMCISSKRKQCNSSSQCQDLVSALFQCRIEED